VEIAVRALGGVPASLDLYIKEKDLHMKGMDLYIKEKNESKRNLL
jgi:hypothetical protein